MNKRKTYQLFLIFQFFILAVHAQYVFHADKARGCDSLDVKFSYSSSETGDTILWNLENGGLYDSTFSVSDTLTAKYLNTGYYAITVYINSDAGNPDTIISLNVYHTVSADFTITDTANVSPGTFYFEHIDQFTEDSGVYTFSWNFGDGNTGTGNEILHTYATSGSYNTSLTVTDTFGCHDEFVQNITVNIPVIPSDADFIADITEGCDSATVKFSLRNISPDSISSIRWNFGNGTFSTQIDPDTVKYVSTQQKTEYDVQVIINASDTLYKENYITVNHTVNAFFECLDTLTSIESINLVCYTLDRQYDSSADYTFNWQFEGIGDMEGSRPLITYPYSLDTITASLTLIDETHGCHDSSFQQIILYPELQVQNVFTPNEDGINDNFQIESLIPIQIKIFNRYGLLVFQGEGTQIIWDGTTATGNSLETGIYFYVLKSFSNDPGNKYNKTGFIHLFR